MPGQPGRACARCPGRMIAGRDEDGEVMQCLSCGFSEPRQRAGNRPMAAALPWPADWQESARARIEECLAGGDRAEAYAIRAALNAYAKALLPPVPKTPALRCRRCGADLPASDDPRRHALRGRCEDEATCRARRHQQGRVA